METLSNLVAKVKRLHLNYNMATSLYMMEPMERTIINCFVILILSLMLYSSWVYLPHYTWKVLVFSGLLNPSGMGENIIVEDGNSLHTYNSEL